LKSEKQDWQVKEAVRYDPTMHFKQLVALRQLMHPVMPKLQLAQVFERVR
jgi:hypothetical protein